MDYSFIDDHCANCATPFSCASQIFPIITVVDETSCSKIQEIQILDAVLFIHGFSATNLASAYLDEEAEEILPSRNKLSETGDYIMKSGLSLCNNCVVVFKEVYVAYRQLKKLSTQAAILSKAIKKFAPTYIKVEVEESQDATGGDGELVDTVNPTSRVANTVLWSKPPPEKLAVVATEEEATDDSAPDELFEELDIKEEYDDYDSGPEDVSTDPLAETELTNVYVLVSSFDIPENKSDDLVTEDLPIVPMPKSTVLQGRGRPRKTISLPGMVSQDLPKKKIVVHRPQDSFLSPSCLGRQDLQTKNSCVGQSQNLIQQNSRIPLENFTVKKSDTFTKCYSKISSLHATSKNGCSTLPLSGLVSQDISTKNSSVPGDGSGKTTIIANFPEEIWTVRKRDASMKCYPNKSLRPANAILPFSATGIHLSRNTASLVSNIESNDQIPNSEIVPHTETEPIEIPEQQPTVKRTYSQERKQKARSNLKKALKRNKSLYWNDSKSRRRKRKLAEKALTDNHLFDKGYESVSDPKKCTGEQSSQNNYDNATSSSVWSLILSEEKDKILQCSCGVASSSLQCLKVRENDASHLQDPLIYEICGNATKITKLPSEIVTMQQRDPSTECYPNKSLLAANATLPFSGTRIHLTRRTASLLPTIETNDQMPNPEIVPETENIEIPEKQSTVKRILSDEQKEKLKLRLQKGRKRVKFIGPHGRRVRMMRQKKLDKKLLRDADLFDKCYERVTKPKNVTGEQSIPNNYHCERSNVAKVVKKCKVASSVSSVILAEENEKILGPYDRRVRRMRQKKLAKKPMTDNDLFDKCFENVTKPINVAGEQSIPNNYHYKSSTVAKVVKKCKVTSSVSSVILAEENEKILKCSCGVACSSLQSLRAHEKVTPHEQEPLICDICGETFMKNYLLYAHKGMEHDEVPEIIFKCTLCDAKFLERSSLKVHVLHHHSPNPFVCDKCGKVFSCSRYLRNHTKGIHKDENLDKELFKCKDCGIQLKHSNSLKKHIRLMHRSQKTFICEQCGKTTKNMTNMRIHMKVHDPNRIVERKIRSESTKTSDPLLLPIGQEGNVIL